MIEYNIRTLEYPIVTILFAHYYTKAQDMHHAAGGSKNCTIALLQQLR